MFSYSCKVKYKDSLKLERRGHIIHKAELTTDFSFSGAQLIYKTEGGYIAGSDSRKDGQAVGF